jgi:branched-chain amino acid transport system ATP-binding protein
MNLEIIDLTVSYGRNNVIEGLNMSVAAGEIVALLGPNGAGKTTLVKAIGGLMRVRGGRILFGSTDISDLSPQRRVMRGISVIPEGRSLFADMTVDENLELGAFTRSDRAASWRDKENWLNTFPVLARLSRRSAGSLSGGEQSLATFARGMMSRPTLMVLDEPSIGVAPLVLAEIGGVMKRARDENGLGCLLVEQDIPFALSIADRAIVMNNGAIAVEASPDELSDGERLRAIFLGVGRL